MWTFIFAPSDWWTHFKRWIKCTRKPHTIFGKYWMVWEFIAIKMSGKKINSWTGNYTIECKTRIWINFQAFYSDPKKNCWIALWRDGSRYLWKTKRRKEFFLRIRWCNPWINSLSRNLIANNNNYFSDSYQLVGDLWWSNHFDWLIYLLAGNIESVQMCEHDKPWPYDDVIKPMNVIDDPTQ